MELPGRNKTTVCRELMKRDIITPEMMSEARDAEQLHKICPGCGRNPGTDPLIAVGSGNPLLAGVQILNHFCHSERVRESGNGP